MRKITKLSIFSGLLVLVMLAGLLGACTQEAPAPAAPAAPPAPIVIGEISAYTGPPATLFEHQKAGMQFAIDEINAAGGIKALGGAKLEMINLDHEFKAELAKEAAERLINKDKVDVFVMGSPSGFGVMIGEICEQAGISNWTLCVNTPEKTLQGFETVFSLPINSEMLGYVGLEYLKHIEEEYLGKKPQTIALLHADNEFNNQNAKAWTSHAPEFGYKVVGDVAYTWPSKDVTPFLLKVKATNPDVLFISDVGEGVQIERALDVQGWDPLRIGLQSSYMGSGIIESLGERAEGLPGVGWFVKGATPDSVTFADKFEAEYGYPADSFSGIGYQNIWVIKAAIEKAGSRDRMAIARAGRELVYTKKDGPFVLPYDGKIDFDETGQVPLGVASGTKMQVQNGAWVSISPPGEGIKFKFRDAWADWKK
ncbi:ABC transporter substrate-binding protein [Bacteroidota bacterium]